MTFEEIKSYLEKKESKQSKVFALLKDFNWHCRNCEGKQVLSGQYAGGGGIQGLERGTKSRPGLVILSENKNCTTCGSQQMHDKITGEIKQSNAPSGISKKLTAKILTHFNHIDVIENRARQSHELVIDHKMPMERWGADEEKNDPEMSPEDIERKFQLLKKDDSGNHNLLKSRSCEMCIATGKRGTPLGIKFWYHGDENWPDAIPKVGPEAEAGCIGCGWYDFNAWRNALNESMQ